MNDLNISFIGPSVPNSAPLSGALADPRLTASGADASLNGLPNELIVQVIVIIQAIDQSIKSLRSLSLTNRRLNYLVIPSLYESFDPRLGRPWLFLRTLISTPQLAQHVKHIHWSDFTESSAIHRPERTAHELVASALYQRPGIYLKRLSLACRDAPRNYGTLLAAAVLYTPRLKSIKAQCAKPASMGVTWIESIQHSSMHAFEHLRSIVVDSQNAEIDMSILLSLPSLRMLDVTGLIKIGAFSQHKWSALPTGASNVEVLKLRSSTIAASTLADVVRACRELRTFLYHHYVAGIGRVPALTYSVLGDALKSHSKTLENLALFGELDDNYAHFPDYRSGYGCMDLRGFPNLHNLVVSLLAVFEPETHALAIPKNVTHLAMSYAGYIWHIEGFPLSTAQHKAICAQSPQLRTLSWCIYDLEEGENDGWEEAQKACADEGVTFNLTYVPIEGYTDIEQQQWYTVKGFIQTWEDVMTDGR